MKNYSYEEIFRMLLPKLKKHYPDIEHRIANDGVDWAFLLSLCYKSGYIRGQLGRSFIIGEPKKTEPKCTERWVPVNGNNVKKGDSVRYINELGHEKTPEYFPTKNVVGKVIKVCSNDNCYIQWPKGSTSRDDRWYAAWDNLEVLVCE